MKIATGVDIIEIERMREAIRRHGEHLLQRIFTPGELMDTKSQPASLAARFAAKEAVAKALGTGIGPVGWRDIEVLHGPAKQPILHLHGAAAQMAEKQGLTQWAISLSHSQVEAIALVIASGD